MIRSGFLAILALLCSAISPAFAMECELPKPAQINVIPTTKAVKYDFSQTLAEIQGQDMDTLNPYSFHSASFTQGFMKGSIHMEPTVKLSGFTEPSKGMACLWYNTIDITIKIDPRIIIAREVYDDPCARSAVLGHEMKHVEVDQELVNSYAKLMAQKIEEGLKARGGFVVGPIPVSQKEQVVNRMQDTVFKIIEREYQRMELDRQDAQSAVDSIEEYERVNAECPDAQKKFRAKFASAAPEEGKTFIPVAEPVKEEKPAPKTRTKSILPKIPLKAGH